MGLFSKIKDVVGDVVDGIVDGIDKITGIDLKKVLDNKWVSRGLMAASLATGGIAIVNGVMQGFNATTAATGFMNKFVEGASAFAKGVGAGLANPIDTAKGIVGAGAPGVSGLAGATPQVNSDIGAAALTESSGAAQSMAGVEGGVTGIDPAQAAVNIGEKAGEQVGAGMIEPLSSQTPVGVPGQLNMPDVTQARDFMDPSTWSGGDANLLTGSEFAPMTPGMSATPDAMSAALANNAKGGALTNILKGAGRAVGDFAKSPQGMMTIANAAQGWAQGAAIEERWDKMQREEKRRRGSFDGFESRAPTFDIPALDNLRARTKSIQARGNQAQAKYGY